MVYEVFCGKNTSVRLTNQPSELTFSGKRLMLLCFLLFVVVFSYSQFCFSIFLMWIMILGDCFFVIYFFFLPHVDVNFQMWNNKYSHLAILTTWRGRLHPGLDFWISLSTCVNKPKSLLFKVHLCCRSWSFSNSFLCTPCTHTIKLLSSQVNHSLELTAAHWLDYRR